MAYSPDSLAPKFRQEHSEILSLKRGNGLWLWKPYIILDALEHVDEGDYVFYCDSGAFFFDSAMPLIESMGDCDVWVSGISLLEEQWTKSEEFRGECLAHREDQSCLSVLCKLKGIKIHRPPYIAPRYYRMFHPKTELKKLVKKLLGIKSPAPVWANARRGNPVYDDTYSPCIFHHRIRRAGSILSVMMQVICEMSLRRSPKFLLKCILAMKN